MSDVILVAIITGGLGFLGNTLSVFFTHKKSTALITYRIDRLEEKVEQHNQLVDRMYKVEGRQNVLENRVEIIEKGGK